MKKTRLNLKMAVWMLMGILVWSLSQVQVHAETQNGGEVSLPHLHAGNPGEEGGCYTVPVYHSHTGSSNSGGGCYTVPISCGGSITAKTESSYCGSLRKWWGTPDDGILRCYAQCSSCGQFWDHVSDDYGDAHYRTSTYYSCDRCGTRYDGTGTCTKTVGYAVGCGKDDAVESYDISCGYSICGRMVIVNQDVAFTKKTALACEVFSEEAGCTVIGYAWSNGGSTASIQVTENGTYTCVVTYEDNCSGETGYAEASISIDNIDTKGPEISAGQSTSEWTKEAVLLTAAAQDDQSGLHENAYSWNSGDWQAVTEYTVTENGTYTLKVRDRLGNESEYVFTVTNIDTEGPEISAGQSTSEWTKEAVLLTATAQDDQSGLHENAYSWNGGDWQAVTEYTVTENGTYTLKMRDRLGNESEYVFTVTNIDTAGPEISAGQSTSEWTKEAVLLTATAQDDQSGLHENAYSWNGGDWQAVTEYTVTENGTYTLKMRDKLGNESEYIFTVSNIDCKLPVINSWNLSTTDLTSDPIKVIVTAMDAESGLAGQAYSLDGENWQSENVFTIRENGIYNVYVRDRAGNVVSLADTDEVITISNIRTPEPEKQEPEIPTPEPAPTPVIPIKDTKAPIVQLTLAIEKWTEGTNKIVVSAQDEQLAQEPYSYDGGLTWTDMAEYEITEQGVYVVFVRDAAANVTTVAIEAIKLISIDNIEPQEMNGDEQGYVAAFASPAETEEEKQQRMDAGITWKMLQEQPAEPDIWRPETTQPVVRIEETETPRNAVYQQSSVDVGKIVAAVAGTAAGGGVFIIFILCFGTSWVPVYAQITSGEYKQIGRVKLQRKKEAYQVRMSHAVLNRAETNLFKVKLGKQFAKKHSSELLRIFGNKTYVDRRVDENVTFQM